MYRDVAFVRKLLLRSVAPSQNQNHFYHQIPPQCFRVLSVDAHSRTNSMDLQNFEEKN